MTDRTSYMDRTGTEPSSMMQAEPGAGDNRLSLSPNDPAFDFVKAWEDGKSYTLTVTVTQVSPGEFEVVSAKPGPEPEEGIGEESTEGGEAEATESEGYRNPAIAKLMASEKS